MEAQHSREKLSMVVHAYSPALAREDAGNLLGLLPSALLIYISSISCPSIICNPLDNIPAPTGVRYIPIPQIGGVQQVWHTPCPVWQLGRGMEGRWGDWGGVLLRSFVFFAIDSSAFLLLSCVPYIFGILTHYQIIVCKYFLSFWFFKAIHWFLDYARKFLPPQFLYCYWSPYSKSPPRPHQTWSFPVSPSTLDLLSLIRAERNSALSLPYTPTPGQISCLHFSLSFRSPFIIRWKF